MADETQNSIFLEQDDEVTAVIERIRNQGEKEVNLVIPKEALILQSIVNVRLLKRAADSMGKKVTIETADEVGAQVARGAGIMANGTFEVPEVVEAAISDTSAETTGLTEPIMETKKEEPKAEEAKPLKKAPSRNFELSIPYLKLNTKNALYLGAGLLVTIFIIYLSFVPRATVAVHPKVEGKAASAEIVVRKDAETELTAGVVKGEEASASKNKTAKFPATGTKDIGEKSKGSIKIINESNSVDITLKKGALITAVDTGKKYALDESVFVGDNDIDTGIDIVAESLGEEFNINSTGKIFRLPAPYNDTDDFRGENTTKIDGGSKKTIKIPTQSDIDSKTQEIVNELAPIVRKELEDKLPNGKVIDSSIAKKTEAKSTPEKDQEAPNGEFELSVTYSETAIVFDENAVLDLLEDTIEKSVTSDQTTYGVKGNTATYTIIKPLESGRLTLKADAIVLVGAKFDGNEIKKGVRGKNVASARKFLASLEGLEDYSVDTKPKWYRRVPGSEKRVEVKIEPRE